MKKTETLTKKRKQRDRGSFSIKHFRDRMDALQLNEKDIARITGLNEKTISYYLTGKRIPRQESIALLASALNVSEDYLKGTTDLERNDLSSYFDSVMKNFDDEFGSTIDYLGTLGIHLERNDFTWCIYPEGSSPRYIDNDGLRYYLNQIKKISSGLMTDYYNSLYAKIIEQTHIDEEFAEDTRRKAMDHAKIIIRQALNGYEYIEHDVDDIYLHLQLRMRSALDILASDDYSQDMRAMKDTLRQIIRDYVSEYIKKQNLKGGD